MKTRVSLKYLVNDCRLVSFFDHPYKILIVGRSGSGKTKTLLILTHYQQNYDITDKIVLYDKNPYEAES